MGNIIFGIIIIIAGVLFLKFHRLIADNIGSGMASYDKFKLYALITCGIGFIVMLNIHIIFFEWIVSLIFDR
jgi:hypothetical protein